MNTHRDYSGWSDANVTQDVIARYELSQIELAAMVCISHASISRAVTGKSGLRPAVRRKLIEMLEAKDTAGTPTETQE